MDSVHGSFSLRSGAHVPSYAPRPVLAKASPEPGLPGGQLKHVAKVRRLLHATTEFLDRALQEKPLASIDVSLGKVVPMGPRREYSALSALLEHGREPTEQCIAALRDVVSEAALGRREKRKPKPHVTLARPQRRATDQARQAGLTWAAGLDLRAVEARLSRIALYTWSEGNRRERLFCILAELPLADDK